jgi:hypothetical protein
MVCITAKPFFIGLKFDGLVKSVKLTRTVIPAKAGIQKYQGVKKALHWPPAFAGVTTFYEVVKI